MAEENGQQPVPQSGDGSALASAICGRCKEKIILRVPPMRVTNTPEFSMLLFTHEQPQLCQRCGMGYIPLIRGIVNGQLDIQFAPHDQKRGPIIVPPTPQQRAAVDATKAKGLVLP